MGFKVNHYQVAREELAFYGEDHTGLQNLIALIIGPNANPKSTGELAALGIDHLASMSVNEFKEFEEVDDVLATRLHAAFRIAERFIAFKRGKNTKIKSTTDAANLFSYMRSYKQEHFAVAFLNTKLEVIARRDIFKGTLDSSLVHPREIFREAIKLSSAKIIVAHNHPSMDTNPSFEDIQVTERLVNSGNLIGIEVLDHIIIGDGFYSLKQEGYI